MMKIFSLILFLLLNYSSFGQSVFVLAKDPKAKELLIYELQKNRIEITDNMSDATYIVEAVMNEVKTKIFKGYIRLVKNGNNKELYRTESDKQKPLISNGYNPQKSIVKLLIDKKDFYAITDYLKEKAPLQVK